MSASPSSSTAPTFKAVASSILSDLQREQHEELRDAFFTRLASLTQDEQKSDDQPSIATIAENGLLALIGAMIQGASMDDALREMANAEDVNTLDEQVYELMEFYAPRIRGIIPRCKEEEREDLYQELHTVWTSG